MITVYSLLVGLALAAGSPLWLFRMITSGRYRAGLGQRLGSVPTSIRTACSGRRTIWVHAVSVGEVLAAERLVGELVLAFPSHQVVVSTTTATGQAIARERFPALPVFFYPLDLAFAVRPWLRALHPELLVLVESELWPRMLTEGRRAGTRVAVVNARMSDRSFRRTYPLRSLWLALTAPVDLFLAQGEETAGRLAQLGVGQNRLQVPGNLKYDTPTTAGREGCGNAMTERIARLLAGARLIVCGSTHAGEEAMLLAAWPALQRAVPDAVLLLAPRHPERFAEVEQLIRASHYPWFRCSDLIRQTEPLFGGTILLLDTLGDLASIYSIASAAFIGGSLVPRGGHNPQEAVRFGIPVLMGPSYENFREMVTAMLAARSVTPVEERMLTGALVQALHSPRTPQHSSRANGATERTVAALQALLAGRA